MTDRETTAVICAVCLAGIAAIYILGFCAAF